MRTGSRRLSLVLLAAATIIVAAAVVILGRRAVEAPDSPGNTQPPERGTPTATLSGTEERGQVVAVTVRVMGRRMSTVEPIANATVALIRPATISQPMRAVFEVKTNGDGRAELINIPLGRIDLVALAEGYVGNRHEVVITSGSLPQEHIVELTALARLTGQVLTPDDLPAPGAVVHLLVPGEVNIDVSLLALPDRDKTRTVEQPADANGSFNLAAVPAGSPLRLLVTHVSGRAEVDITNPLAPGESRSLVVTLTPPTVLTGKAPPHSDSNRETTVRSWAVGSDGFSFIAERKARVGPDGTWMLENLKPGKKSVTFAAVREGGIDLAGTIVQAEEARTTDTGTLQPADSEMYVNLEVEGGMPAGAIFDVLINDIAEQPTLSLRHYEVRTSLTHVTRIVGLTGSRIQVGLTLLNSTARGPDPGFRYAFAEQAFDGRLGEMSIVVRRRQADEAGSILAALSPPPGVLARHIDSAAYILDQDDRVVLSHPGPWEGGHEHLFKPVPAGAYRLVVVANGFVAVADVVVSSSQAAILSIDRWTKNRTKTVRVEGEDSSPVSGAICEIVAAGVGVTHPVFRVRSDEHGSLVLPDLPGLTSPEIIVKAGQQSPSVRLGLADVGSVIQFESR